MGDLPIGWEDLESSVSSPVRRECSLLGVPAIMVAGIPIVSTSSLSKVFQGNWSVSFGRIKGDIPWDVVFPDQVVAFDLPLIADVIHDDVAILKVPSRW